MGKELMKPGGPMQYEESWFLRKCHLETVILILTGYFLSQSLLFLICKWGLELLPHWLL